MLMTMLSMFITFIGIGAVAFGGGYAMLPLFERMIVDTHGWLTNTAFLDMLAIAQVTPGPISINSATFIGFQINGIIGATLATTGLVFVPVILVSLISHNAERFKKSRLAQGIFIGLRPAFVGLIFASVYSVAGDAYVDIYSVILFGVLLVLLRGFKVHPIIVIVIAAIAGYVIYI